MTNQVNKMAALAGWLEENCGQNQAESILDQVNKMRCQGGLLQCMEIMLLAEIIYGYRKDMLRQIKEYKALRTHEYAQDVATFHVRKELKSMKESIASGIACWKDLRTLYFFERERYMECCKWPHSGIVCVSKAAFDTIVAGGADEIKECIHLLDFVNDMKPREKWVIPLLDSIVFKDFRTRLFTVIEDYKKYWMKNGANTNKDS